MSPRKSWVQRVATFPNLLGLWAITMSFGAIYVMTGIHVFFWVACLAVMALGFCGGVWIAERAFGKQE